jgi:hypothetical protein
MKLYELARKMAQSFHLKEYEAAGSRKLIQARIQVAIKVSDRSNIDSA